MSSNLPLLSQIAWSLLPLAVIFLFVIIFSTAFALRAMSLTAFLQQKNYRFDRLWTFLRYEQGWKEMLGRTFVLEAILALLWTFKGNIPLFIWFFIVTFASLVYETSTRGVRRPIWSTKSSGFLFLQLLVDSLLLVFFGIWLVPVLLAFQWGLSLSLLTFLSPINALQKRYILQKATKKRQQLSHLQVIGITGSYGKTSTKEFLFHLLQSSYRVIATPKNINSDIGVARFFLKEVNDSFDYCIVEMGAYRIGEIDTLCKMLHPSIGILTGINSQHIGLFGSQENIVKAKFELIHALPSDGLALLNTSCDLVQEGLRAKAPQSKVVAYSLGNSGVPQLAPPQEGILEKQRRMKGDTDLPIFEEVIGENQKNRLNVNSKNKTYGSYAHNLEHPGLILNLIPCIVLSHYLQIPSEQIQNAINTLTPPLGVLQRTISQKDDIIFNDTYNSNIDGFFAALNMLKGEKLEQKIVISSGILELGKYASDIYNTLFASLDKSTDIIIFTKPFLEKYIHQYVFQHVAKEDIFVSESTAQIIRWLKMKKKTRSAILLEGRLKEDLIRYIRSL